MKLLGIDTSGMVASVAVMEDDILIGEYTLNYKKTHSQTLMPMLDELTKALELDLSTIDAIAVAVGPGSFTGLRIGAAAVKGLAMALDKPVIEISTLEGLAYSCCESEKVVCPILDARRKQTYAAGYEFDTVAKEVIAQDALAIEDFIEKVNAYGKNALFLGDGVPVFKEDIEKLCTVPFSFAKPGQNRQSASSVLRAAKDKFDKGELKQGDELRLNYLRVSQAERERAEKGL
ncbi:MAG: tRNA (adenosine(37)-N6)-threonylcarbamoyltransferase complex dimerization subunit type 1 TsaB [Lachnospiraceae bacterium]|nr:tRNA (adenosine(37)-N6)-threonylcarbamoyltransferase complex dimerization subunit type 1 TsaB [Lachnospiraceae bacterium]